MADVMAHDHPVAQIVEKRFEGRSFFDALAAFITGHAVDGHGRRIPGHANQRVERITEHQIAVLNGHRTHRDDAVGARIEARGFGIEHHEAHAIDRAVRLPRGLEAPVIPLEKRRSAHRVSSHVIPAVKSINRRIDRNPLFRR